MPEFSITTGSDTFVYEPAPTTNYAQSRSLRIRSGQAYSYVTLPINLPAGTVVLSATLLIPVHGSWVAQTVTVKSVAVPWSVSAMTWNRRASVLEVGAGISASTVTGALNPGDWVEVDVTAMVQAIVNGRANYGFRVESSQSSAWTQIRSFESGYESWALNLVTSEAPLEATPTAPRGIVSVSKWVAQVDEVDSLASIRVQVDPAANGTTPAFDSGVVATSEPVLDLAATAYAGLADGASTYWRAQVKTLDGEASGWSDWVQVTRHVKPTMTLSSPSGTDLWDPSPSIDASLSPAGTAATRWQVIVLNGTNPTDVRYDSGSRVSGATLDHSVPLKVGTKAVFPTDGAYTIIVRAWDRMDRVASIGDPPYVETVRNVTLTTSGSTTAPTALTVTQATGLGYPQIVLSWTRAADPDWFDVRRNGVVVERVDVDDARVSPGVWEWADDGATPWEPATYTVRAVTNNLQSASSPAAVITPEVTGVWLRSTFGDVMLAGDDIDNFAQTDKRTTIELPYRSEDVDIITAVAGVSGTYKGFLSTYDGDVDAARVILEKIRQRPDQSVRLVAATLNADVYLRGLSVTPSSDIIPDRNRRHTVSFGFFETGD